MMSYTCSSKVSGYSSMVRLPKPSLAQKDPAAPVIGRLHCSYTAVGQPN